MVTDCRFLYWPRPSISEYIWRTANTW